MKTAFPKYDYTDIVDEQYRLVTEGLGTPPRSASRMQTLSDPGPDRDARPSHHWPTPNATSSHCRNCWRPRRSGRCETQLSHRINFANAKAKHIF
jgi:hypothetical protein